MDATAADYTKLSVSLLRQEDQDRALVGIDLHGEFIPFAELKLAAVDELLANAAERHAQAQKQAPAPEPEAQAEQTEPEPQTPQTEPEQQPEPPQQ